MSRRIGIVSLGYAWMPCESGTSRFYYIANLLCQQGYEVEIVTTGFQHFEKKPRDKELLLSQGYPFKLTFIDVMPYKKNLDLRRIISNHFAAKKVVKYLKTTDFDAVYCSIPANNIAAAVGEYCNDKGIPFIVDIEDLWPEAMSLVVKKPLVRRVAFGPFLRDAEATYAAANGVVGTSEDYTARAFAHRKQDIPSETVYVGCDLDVFDAGVKEYQSEVTKADGEFWVTYAGSISNCYDIKTLIDAGYALREKNVQVQILGTGSMKEELETYSKDMENIHFHGFVPYPKMAAVLTKSDLVVNSFVKGAPQSIVNKIGDYLAAGKPMINTLENPMFCKLVEEQQVGCNVEPENVEALKCAILSYLDGDKGQSEKARRLAEERFDRKVSYLKIRDMIEEVCK